MSSYGSAHSGQLHPGYQAPPQQQRARSYSNPPYPTTPGSAPYPQQQSSYFPPPPPTAPYQQAPPTSNPIAIPAANRKRASSDYANSYGTSPSYPHPTSPYAHSFPTQYLQPIPQQHPIPETYPYPPQQQQQPNMASSPSYSHHHRRRSSSSNHGYDPRHSYESAHSYQSAQSHHAYPSPDLYARQAQNGHGNHDDRYNYGNENEGFAHQAAPEPPKDYGDWDREEVQRYKKNQDLERRPTLGGSLMSFVKKIGGSERR